MLVSQRESSHRFRDKLFRSGGEGDLKRRSTLCFVFIASRVCCIRGHSIHTKSGVMLSEPRKGAFSLRSLVASYSPGFNNKILFCACKQRSERPHNMIIALWRRRILINKCAHVESVRRQNYTHFPH